MVLYVQEVVTRFEYLYTYFLKWVTTSWTNGTIYQDLDLKGSNGDGIHFVILFSFLLYAPRSVDLFDIVTYYWAFHILPQIYTANYDNFPIQIYAITV